MNNWIWWQRYHSDDAQSVGSYYNITNEPDVKPLFESKQIFKPELKGVFKREKIKIGFNAV